MGPKFLMELHDPHMLKTVNISDVAIAITILADN